MLRVIWGIFIIVGVLLLVLLAILLAVLFVSVTCWIRGERADGRLSLCVTAGWLFRALTLRFTVDQEQEEIKPRLVLRVFGIPIKSLMGEEQKPKKEKKPGKSGEAVKGSEAEEPVDEAAETENEAADAVSQEAEAPDSRESFPSRSTKSQKKARRRRGLFHVLSEKLHAFAQKFRAIGDRLRRIPKFFRNLRRKLQEIRDKKDFIMDFWKREEHVRARGAIIKELFYLLKKLKPKRIEGRVHFGFEDPSLTGRVMGAASVFYPWYPGKLELEPDFENQVLEGNLYIFAKLRLYVLVVILARLIFNGDVRLMYRNWKER